MSTPTETDFRVLAGEIIRLNHYRSARAGNGRSRLLRPTPLRRTRRRTPQPPRPAAWSSRRTHPAARGIMRLAHRRPGHKRRAEDRALTIPGPPGTASKVSYRSSQPKPPTPSYWSSRSSSPTPRVTAATPAPWARPHTRTGLWTVVVGGRIEGHLPGHAGEPPTAGPVTEPAATPPGSLTSELLRDRRAP